MPPSPQRPIPACSGDPKQDFITQTHAARLPGDVVLYEMLSSQCENRGVFIAAWCGRNTANALT